MKISAKLIAGQPSDLNNDSSTGRLCQITIEDNGIGFDEKYSDRIFEVFQRLHGREEYEGTSIGLSICRKIVNRHKGAIKVKSTLGQGSTFMVTLPLKQTASLPPLSYGRNQDHG